MDNLEFLQWMKRYFEINYNGEPYDAVGRRKGQDLYYILGGGKVGGAGGAKPTAKPKTTAAAPSKIGVGAKPKTTTAAAVGTKKTSGGDSDAKQL
jgi:RP/EB family microtubule-associated protein